MESMRKSNILSLLLCLLVSSSRIRTYSLLNWPKIYISHCGGPFFLMSLVIIPFSKIFFWHYYWIHKPIMSHFYFLFLIKHSFKCVALLCIYIIVIVLFINLYVGFKFFYVCIFIWVTPGSFVPHIDRQKPFLKL
jgi:hypothetical protein